MAKAKKSVAKRTAKKSTATKSRSTAKKTTRTKKAAPKKAVTKKTTRTKKATPRKATAKKATARKSVAKKPKTKTKRKPNAAFMKPMTPSAALGAVIGTNPMPRTEVTKKIWDYIKRHKLQDSANKRMINADEKLKMVFGGKRQVSMFEMTKLVAGHLK